MASARHSKTQKQRERTRNQGSDVDPHGGRERRVLKNRTAMPQWETSGRSAGAQGLAEDAARLIPELAPLVGAVIDTPMELPPTRVELRERAEALIAEYDAP